MRVYKGKVQRPVTAQTSVNFAVFQCFVRVNRHSPSFPSTSLSVIYLFLLLHHTFFELTTVFLLFGLSQYSFHRSRTFSPLHLMWPSLPLIVSALILNLCVRFSTPWYKSLIELVIEFSSSFAHCMPMYYYWSFIFLSNLYTFLGWCLKFSWSTMPFHFNGLGFLLFRFNRCFLGDPSGPFLFLM